MTTARVCIVCFAPLADRKPGQPGRESTSCSTECRKAAAVAHKRSYHLLNAARDNDRARLARSSNREHRKEQDRLYYLKNKARIRTLERRVHHAAIREIERVKSKQWREANWDKYQDRRRAWVAKNKARYDLAHRKNELTRRAKKRQAFIEPVDPSLVFDRSRGICGICLSAVEKNQPWEVDHIVPLSKGGAHGYDNVQLAHESCNRSKGAKLPTGPISLFQKVG